MNVVRCVLGSSVDSIFLMWIFVYMICFESNENAWCAVQLGSEKDFYYWKMFFFL